MSRFAQELADKAVQIERELIARFIEDMAGLTDTSNERGELTTTDIRYIVGKIRAGEARA
jgi:hypothetical protein